MYSSKLENQLIISDIADIMQDYVSIQLDIDNTKIKAAAIVAQNIDIKRVIGKDNLDRCIEPSTDDDKDLLELLIPPLCYFTYYRCLKMFQGTFTDSGYTTETEAEERNTAKSVANEIKSIAETFMLEVVEYLREEDPETEVTTDNNHTRIRVFGGCEARGSN